MARMKENWQTIYKSASMNKVVDISVRLYRKFGGTSTIQR